MQKSYFLKVAKQPIFLLMVLFIIFGLFLFLDKVLALDYVSSNFIMRDPVITIEGGRSTASSFTYFSSSGQLNSGISTSSNFSVYGGFLYFPNITDPSLTATAGNAQVSLSWTESTSTFGYVVTAYEVGQGTVSGGPYTYTNVGNVLSSTRSSLSNGTAYYFIIRVIDNQGDVIATSTQATATPVAPAVVTPPPSGGGGGGGGGYVPPPLVVTSAVFMGRAYPKSTVTLLKDAQIAATTVAGADANFKLTLSGLTGGNYIFSVYGEDNKGIRSSLLTFPISITTGATTNVSGIFIAPTIAVDKSEVKLGDTISIFGQTISTAEVLINVNSEPEFFFKVKATSDGIYFHQMDTTVLNMGSHLTKSKAIASDGAISSFSSAVAFTVGTKNVTAIPQKFMKGDLNNDGWVNLVDFSIAAYWYKRPLSATFKPVEIERLNGDGKVDLVDFSIMAFYWTG